jgi:hypothetical protein
MKFRFTLCMIVALLFSAVILAAGQTKIRNTKPEASAVSMEEVRVVNVEALPQKVAPSAAPTGRFANLRPQNGLSDAQFATMKQTVAQRHTAAPSGQALHPAMNAMAFAPDTPALQTNFDGINVNCSGLIPSDMALAANGSWVVQTVNDCFAVYNKSGALQAGFPKDLNSLFGVPANNFNTGQFVTDPRGFYDAVAARFVIVALWEDLPNSRGLLEVATSKTSDPRGLWNIYSREVSSPGNCPDFPTVGHNRYGDKFVGAVAVGFNVFACSPSGFGAYEETELWFLPKVQLYKALPFTFWYYFNLPTDTLQAANVDSASDAARAIFALSSFNINYGGGQCVSGCSGLELYAFTNVIYQGASAPVPVATLMTVPTSTYTLPPNASQPFTLNTIDTNDVRISGSVAYSQGYLYATVTTDNGGGGPGIYAWQLHADLDDNGDGHCTGAFLNACPQLTSASIDREMNYDVNPSGGYFSNAYFGTIHPDGGGNITMVFNFSGYTTYAGTNYLSQRVTMAPQPTFHDGGSTLRSGLAAYPYGRWGDYTGAAWDGTSVWFSGMYANSAGLWNTGIGKTGYTSATQP